jgi:hypothetical protein
MHYKLDSNFWTASNSTIQINLPKTKIIQCLEKHAEMDFEIHFTNAGMGEKCKHLDTLLLMNVFGMGDKRHGLTLFEVKIGNETMVLKCINTEKKSLKNGAVVTYTETETKSFDALPDILKPDFVTKYAHGRIFVKPDLTYEFILMEKMYPTSMADAFWVLNRSQTEAFVYEWWVKAIEKLIKIHDAGFIHGDCHLGNILWTEGICKGDVKWIDPERMIKIPDSRDEASIWKLQEIMHILMFSAMFMTMVDPTMNFDIQSYDFNRLHLRLVLINQTLPASKQPLFYLHDTIMFDTTMKYARPNGYSPMDLNGIRASNPSQYERMQSVDYRGFLVKLTDQGYLKKTVVYLAKQARKCFILHDMTVTPDDLYIPVESTEDQSAAIPAVLTPQPTQVVAQQVQVTPLKYFNDFVMLQIAKQQFSVAYFSFVDNAAVLCLKNAAGTAYPVRKQSSYLFTLKAGRVTQETDGGLPLQFTLEGMYMIVRRQVQNTLIPLYLFDLTKYPAQFVHSYAQPQ